VGSGSGRGSREPDTVAERGARPAARTGELIGQRYELLEEIGYGAFGRVFRARDRVAEKIVALKVFAPRQPAEEVKRLRREVQLAHRVTHPGVVRTYDIVEAEGRICMSMEYIEGETLGQRLHRPPPLAAQELSQLALDLARALGAAHRVGVIHRDLKPANVILRVSSGRAVIADFGISRQEDPELDDDAITHDGQVVGTPQYMAPEQLLSGEVGPPADLYAWGLVIFEAATGKLPHSGRTVAQLAVERRESKPPKLETLRPDLPIALCRAVEQCLHADTGARPPNGDALKNLLVSMAATGDQTAPRPKQWSHKRTTIYLSALLLVLAVAVVFAWRRATIPPRDRRLHVSASGSEAWIAQPLEHLVAAGLRSREPRLHVTDEAHANVGLRLEYRRTQTGISVDASVAHSKLLSLDAPSLAGAADRIVEVVYDRLAAEQPIGTPDPDEVADMQRLGTDSYEAWWKYRAGIEQDFSAVLIDAEASDRAMQAVANADPKWAHAWVSLIDGRGIASVKGQETLREAKRALAGATQDPVGRNMVAAIDAISEGHLSEAALLLDPEYRKQPDDVYLGWLLSRRVFHAAGRTQDAIAVFQRLYDLRPDLQFGANLIDELRRAGRGREVGPLVEDWLKRSPESEDARAAQVVVDLEAGRVDDAVKHAREQVFVHGEAPHRLATLCDVLIVAGQDSEASRLAEAMLRGSGPIRSRGWLRLGIIAALEGRFSAAREAYGNAIAEGKSFPWQSGLRVAYESARWLSAILGWSDESDRYHAELGDFYRRSGMPWQAAAVEFDRRLLHVAKEGCPSREAALQKVPAGPGRELAALQMLRSAAGAGCASCADVVKEGLSADEWNQQGLYRFGTCALSENALGLARDAFERAKSLRHSSVDAGAASSEVFAVLARYQLGRVLEKLGQKAAAKKAYDDFLAHWGHADRTLDEVEEARKAVARLQ
jgi:serine/threonine protein kinase/tetratricopeptide (TPR) repeat protein